MHTYYEIELKDDDYAIANSTGPEKFSTHIILKNYVVVNNREALHLTKLLIDDHLPEFLWPCVDPGIGWCQQREKIDWQETRVVPGEGEN